MRKTFIPILFSLMQATAQAADGINGDLTIDFNGRDIKVLHVEGAAGSIGSKAAAIKLGSPAQTAIGGVAIDGGRIGGNVVIKARISDVTVSGTGGQTAIGGVAVRGN